MTLNWTLKQNTPQAEVDSIPAGDDLWPQKWQKSPSDEAVRHEAMLINEVSLVLSEKRTALSVMRTGLAILTLPISVLSVLVVISRYYDPMKVIHFLGPLVFLCVLLAILGSYMIIRSLRRISHLDRVIVSLKIKNANLRELCLVMDNIHLSDDDND